jgi:microcystin degradation protein MlrC
MRIGVGCFSSETNTFSPVLTDIDAFARQLYHVGADLDVNAPAGPSSMGGFVDVARERDGVEFVPLVRARTGAGGRVTVEAFEEVTGHFAEQLAAAGQLDAVYIELHGAMAMIGHDDPEGLLLEQVRAHIGPDVPLVASLDHHANVTRRKVDNADILVGHRTQPHEPYHTGQETARALLRMLDERLRPTMALRKAPMVTHQEQYLTRQAPMKTWFDLAREMESRPGVITVSTFPMQPWLDVEEGGWASVVVTDDDLGLAEALAEELTRCVWGLREDLMVQLSIPVAEAVRQAEQAASGVVVLSDTGDSMLGGAAGDSNEILAELVRQQVSGTALVPLVDEPAALRAAELGVGQTAEFMLGRALDPAWGDPIRVTAEVLLITDGRIGSANRASTGAGQHVDIMGPHEMGVSALLRIGNVLVSVSQYRGRGGVHPAIWAHFGVDASEAKMVVVKTASNFQHYADVTSEVIRVDTAGHTQSRVTDFEWTRLPRPAFPLDEGVELGC